MSITAFSSGTPGTRYRTLVEIAMDVLKSKSKAPVPAISDDMNAAAKVRGSAPTPSFSSPLLAANPASVQKKTSGME